MTATSPQPREALGQPDLTAKRHGELFAAWRRGDHAAARAGFRAVLERDHDDGDAWRGLGSVLWSIRAFDACLDAFGQALRCEPLSPMHWSDVGLALRELKRADLALQAFDVALRLDGSYAPAWNERSNVLFDVRCYPDALPGYDRAIALSPKAAVYHHNRAECLLAVGDRDGAKRGFCDALAIDSGYGFSRQRLRWMKQR